MHACMRDSVLVDVGRFIITEAAQPAHVAAIVVNGYADSRKLLFQLQKLAFMQLVILQWNDDQSACVIRTSLFIPCFLGGIKVFSKFAPNLYSWEEIANIIKM